MGRTILGRLVPVDLRRGWPREDHDFTHWPAEPDNLAFLGNVLGLILEPEPELRGRETPVGSFFCDILCRGAAQTAGW